MACLANGHAVPTWCAFWRAKEFFEWRNLLCRHHLWRSSPRGEAEPTELERRFHMGCWFVARSLVVLCLG